MSVQAVRWALRDAPNVPASLVSTLVALAEHAGADGRNAYPAQPLLARYTRKTERAVRKDLQRLMDLGLVRLGDQRVVAKLPSNRRPVVYDLVLDRKHGSTQHAHLEGNESSTQEEDSGGNHSSTPGRNEGSGRNHSSGRNSRTAWVEPQFQLGWNHSSAKPNTEPPKNRSDYVGAPQRPPTANESNDETRNEPEPEPATTQTIVGEWLDRSPGRPPGAVIGQVSKSIKKMLDEGTEPDAIRRGIAAWMARGLHPASLPSVVYEEMTRAAGSATARASPKRSTTDDRVAAAQSLKAKFHATTPPELEA